MTRFTNNPYATSYDREYSDLCESRGQIPPYVLSKLKFQTNRPFDHKIQNGDVFHCDYDVPLRVFFDNGLEFRLTLKGQLHAEVFYHLPTWIYYDRKQLTLIDNAPASMPASHEMSLEHALTPWDAIEAETITAHEKIKHVEKLGPTPIHSAQDLSNAVLMDAGAFEHGKALISLPNTTLLLNRRDGSGLYWGFVRKLCRSNQNWLQENDPNEDLLRPYFFGGGMSVVERLVEAAQNVNDIWRHLSEHERLKHKFDSRKKPKDEPGKATQTKFIL